MILEPYCSDCSLFDIFSCLYREPEAVLLDSSLKNKYGQYSIAGFLPAVKAEETDGVFYLNDLPQSIDTMDWLKQYLAENREENPTSLPFISGGIGYLTYDYGKRFMGLPHVHRKQIHMPDFHFVFYRLYIIEESKTGKITLAARDEDAIQWFRAKERETNFWRSEKVHPAVSCSNTITSDFTQEDYQAAIQAMIDYIIAGDIYITNMTRQIEIRSDADPYSIFRVLRQQNPSPFGGYFHSSDVEIVSASPERFFEIRSGVIRTRPIKGTRKRGRTSEEDLALRLELEHSEKDKSELLMIVDLERNDLSRVCRPGSVKVEELFVTEAYATVFHLVSTVCGTLQPDRDAVDVLKSMFPGGSITGAPKYRSMEIIDELEHSRRGLYTGSMGYIGFDGNCDFNIVIRTMVYQDGCYHIGAGGGITCESEPEFEYEETCQKAAALMKAADRAAQGDVE